MIPELLNTLGTARNRLNTAENKNIDLEERFKVNLVNPDKKEIESSVLLYICRTVSSWLVTDNKKAFREEGRAWVETCKIIFSKKSRES